MCVNNVVLVVIGDVSLYNLLWSALWSPEKAVDV